MAYRGYLIRRNPIRESYSIEKDGAHVCYASDYFDARRIIDMLTEGV